MNSVRPAPDALVVGAPKAGTSALHAALARHPDVFAPRVKEPKYYLCGDAPPSAYRGPGDAHSQQEWVWRRRDYEGLFAPAPPGALRIESTPFYLYLPDARRRIAEDLPTARFVVLLRDPVDRAYSNWMHLRADGLEPVDDFGRACDREDERVEAGWAPFWHYLRLGRYGEQLADLLARVGPERVLVLRYRQLVEDPTGTLDRVARFLGLREGAIAEVPRDNSRPWVGPGPRTAALGRLVRLGAAAGAHVPPQVWRQAVRPLYAALQAGGDAHRPPLDPAVRARLVARVDDDITVLEGLLGESFDDWRSATDRGSFSARAAARATS
ncbi:sulfotransferase family protein [Phycicoccus avicenniae]|uniref:sulfotransferase family protein n=1 Tax=Phycicoccus avicenniae TaxID=2828860 RepID=UPI003D2ADD6D